MSQVNPFSFEKNHKEVFRDVLIINTVHPETRRWEDDERGCKTNK